MWLDKILRNVEHTINRAVDSTKQEYDPDKEYAIALGPDGRALSPKQQEQQLNKAVDELKDCFDNLEDLDPTTGRPPV
jgi:hypothetical protein